ncbi:imidazole glycerol phosphate synthase subunit HisH [Metallumcola ferriviriculae]|uniref:Imidazole glycerol phosphate synthase subunit HisH n=1 Tax=Metallumcola ferriviriculae TaxID=3039180 RepID=A0AAU0UT51_9FIRM|nr:imidazole glycerol phosphate synthase subunit HisH [Desulfitibacteraceae bacterium MK1]
MGNLRSVQKALESVGLAGEVTSNEKIISTAPAVILPGVGAFEDAMANLTRTGLIPIIREVVAKGTPFLGICLGMQLLFSTSEENGLHQGLNLLPGTVKRLPPGLKVPHMGWNQLVIRKEEPMLKGVNDGDYFYFVHSYYVQPEDDDVIIAASDYGFEFPALVGRDNLMGIQFHPEKSSNLGLQILKNFGEMVNQC